MEVIRDVMTALEWWSFTPATTAWGREPGFPYLPTSVNDRFVVSYVARGVAMEPYTYGGPPINYYFSCCTERGVLAGVNLAEMK